ncbi:amidase domain-containing protein [Oscillospiraceae bacterium MB08-C2-2]|nr:amidase domain-containing protein [Oscillospiraceae bacterium MB08-C2-2]
MSRPLGSREIPYNREKAVAYAHKWALGRNPAYYNFTGLGGDCANFASQCLHAGGGVMNYKPLFGWYYNSPSDRTPSWSGVKYLYNFLTSNIGPGPFAVETDITAMEPGDIIQLAVYREDFHHTLVVVETGSVPDYQNTLIACHSYDSDYRPLDTYSIRTIRFLHIEGYRG